MVCIGISAKAHLIIVIGITCPEPAEGICVYIILYTEPLKLRLTYHFFQTQD